MTSSMPWVKIWTDIIHDPKIGKLPDATKWRFVQLIVLAGDYDQEGFIPGTIEEIAWSLHIEAGILAADLILLCPAGLVKDTGDGLLIINFSKRQDRPQHIKREQWRKAQEKFRNKPAIINDNDNESSEQKEDVIYDTDITNTTRGEERRGREEEEERRFITAIEAEEIFCNVTGMVTIPNTENRDLIIDQICKLKTKHADLETYLLPFYNAWCRKRGKNGNYYSKNNPGWLAWAISGEIPPDIKQVNPLEGFTSG